RTRRAGRILRLRERERTEPAGERASRPVVVGVADRKRDERSSAREDADRAHRGRDLRRLESHDLFFWLPNRDPSTDPCPDRSSEERPQPLSPRGCERGLQDPVGEDAEGRPGNEGPDAPGPGERGYPREERLGEDRAQRAERGYPVDRPGLPA